MTFPPKNPNGPPGYVEFYGVAYRRLSALMRELLLDEVKKFRDRVGARGEGTMQQ